MNWLPLLAAAPAVLLAVQVHLTCGGIVYSLDDPYIHLALAKHIAQGHYGINAGEFASPSSSILWPFLLAPFAATPVFELVPLVLNTAALLVTVWWIQRWLETWMPPPWALLATTALAFALNFYGLVLTGMEHSLQVMLVAIVGISLMRGRLAWPFWLAVTLLPLVRYEGMAISLAALGYTVLGREHRLHAIASGAVICAIVGGFSLFLHGLGLGWLPSSVMAKTSLIGGGFLGNLQLQLAVSILAVLAFGLLLREGRYREAVLLVALPTLLHLTFGKHGWFGRYHIYFAVWIVILFSAVYARSTLSRSLALNALLAAGFAWGAAGDMGVTLATAASARNVHDQQKQMALIVRDHLDEPVAVNDIGFVALYARRHVLDLYGLASYEALMSRNDPATEVWVRRLMQRQRVELAIVYAKWFERRPVDWIHVATLHLPAPWVVDAAGDDKVDFYATGPEAAVRLRRALEAYRKGSPQAAMMLEMAPP